MGNRRRSDELDRLLDRLDADGEPEATGDLAPFLHPVRVARATLSAAVPDEVARDHLAALREDRARNVVVPAARRRGLRLATVGLVGAVVLTLGASSAVAASSRALPGDALYGVKLAVERVSLAMHRDPVGRASHRLEAAGRRLVEVQALIAAGEDPGEALEGFEDALAGAESEALRAQALGRDAEALLAHVQEMISKHISVLSDVLGRVPEQAQDAIQRAIDNAKKAQDKVQQGRQKEKPAGGKPTAPPGKSGEAPGRS